MPFNVRIGFTGVCSFIMNSDPQREVRACVVLPDAEGEGMRHTLYKKAPDGTNLRRHRAFLKFNLKQWSAITDKAMIPGGAEGLLYIEGKRVTFRFTEAGQVNSFRVAPDLLDYVVAMDEIAGAYADDYLGVVAAAPPSGVVAAQILINKGYLSNDIDVRKLLTWVLPPTLNGKMPPVRKTLTHEVALGLEQITKVEIFIAPLGGGDEESIILEAEANEDVGIAISHLCNENPMRWVSEDVEAVDDNDFKWHYMLFSPSNLYNLEVRVLRGLSLPVPLRQLNRGTAGQGVNCPPSVGLSRLIDLDNFIKL